MSSKSPETEGWRTARWWTIRTYTRRAGSIDLGSNCVDGEKVGFKGADAGDFRIDAFSSCRNKGLFLDWMDGATDLDGNPRIFGKAPDIGCYECQVGPGLMLLMR